MNANRRRWFWIAQAGVCALGIHPACIERKQLMRWVPSGHCRGGDCTWEHVYPRHRYRGAVLGRFRVLACSQCNAKKSAAPPTDEYVERALALNRAWFEHIKEPRYMRQIEEALAPATGPKLAEPAFPPNASAEELDQIARDGLLEYLGLGRQARAAALGVTDPAYMPGAKRAASR